MSTVNFGWTLPKVGTDPWYAEFVDAFQQVDTTMGSMQLGVRETIATVQTNLVPRPIVVVSAVPSDLGPPPFTVSSVEMQQGHGGWVLASAAPYGQWAGSFAIANAGSRARFELTLAGRAGHPDSGTVGSTFGSTRLRIWWRLICRGSGVTSLVVPTNSAWGTAICIDNELFALPTFTAMTSLGVGNYSCELQTRIQTVAHSMFCMSLREHARLTMIEVRS